MSTEPATTIDELKEAVWRANLELVEHGLVTLTWGNVSGLAEGGELFAIKPSGVKYSELRPEHVVLVSVETGEPVEHGMRPSSDTPTHALLYRELSGIGGVTHTHSPRATAFAQARRPIPCYGTTHADHFYGPIPVTRPLTEVEIEQAYELNTGRVIAEAMAGVDALGMPGVLVASHAPFAWGKHAADSVKNAVALEAVAQMAIDTLTILSHRDGADREATVDQFLLDKHYFRKHGPGAYYGQPGGAG